MGSSSTIYTTSSGSLTSFTCFAYDWISPTTGSVNLTFEFRHDPDYWILDDVLVYSGGTQILGNTGFETGFLSPWVHSAPFGNCGIYPGQVATTNCHSGTYCFNDGSNGCSDRISQQFSVVAGNHYTVSFWLKSNMAGSVVTAIVTL